MTYVSVNTRYLAIDLLRLLIFQAIVIYHSSWIIWISSYGPPDPFPTPIWRAASIFARALAFSGFTLAFLCSFLFGFKNKSSSKKSWIFLFLALGWLIYCFCVYFKELGKFHLMWDIYPLLCVGFLTGQFFLKRSVRFQVFLVFLFLLGLSIPFWRIGLKFTPWLAEVLIGRCPFDYADWPILPWIFLIWLGLIIGNLVNRGVVKYGNNFLVYRSKEYFFWVFIVIVFIPFSGSYYKTLLGDSWACFTFRQSPVIFFSNFFFWVLIIRIALIPSVQSWLSRNKIALWLSNLSINRHFFLAYLIHYVVLISLVGLLSTYHGLPLWATDFIVLFTLPITEIWIRALLKVTNRQRSLGSHINEGGKV